MAGCNCGGKAGKTYTVTRPDGTTAGPYLSKAEALAEVSRLGGRGTISTATA